MNTGRFAIPCGPGAAHCKCLTSQVEAGGLLPRGALEAVKEAKVERRLGSAMHMSMHSNMTDSARLGEHLFGIPQARKGLIGRGVRRGDPVTRACCHAQGVCDQKENEKAATAVSLRELLFNLHCFCYAPIFGASAWLTCTVFTSSAQETVVACALATDT